MTEMRVQFDVGNADDYRRFLRVKSLPAYRITGREATVPAEYAAEFRGGSVVDEAAEYEPIPGLFDYQRDIAAMAIARRKFAVFAECGMGKTAILLEYARHVRRRIPGRRVLIVAPLMVAGQTIVESQRWYGDSLPIERVPAAKLAAWIGSDGDAIGVTNYDALHEGVPQGRLGCLILDESSMLKSHYGKWGRECIRLGTGLDWKLALTGTPAPNDRIEYANHAVFLDAFPNVNAFLAKFFVNRGQTGERWELKPHAIGPFYRALSHWCIFLTNPGTYGWKDNAAGFPPIRVHIHDIAMGRELTEAAQAHTGTLFANKIGGIGSRAKLSRLAKGDLSPKPDFIRGLVGSWPGESSIVWCKFNDEQDRIASLFPGCANVSGSTPMDERERLVAAFQAGEKRVLVTKPKILGFGLNLQVATRQVFSTLLDSYEEFHQAVKRSNRVGSTLPLNVHIPVTDIEMPMIETVLAKADRVRLDSEEQERIFKENRHAR